MAKKYLDDAGVLYFWQKLKGYFQVKLVSGTNIKTINNESVLGSGNISISGSGSISVLDFYPVGSYYETSDTSFNPNTSWGGTWELEAAGQFHVSAGTGYTTGSTGGSANIQAHTHSFTQPAYQIAANALTSSGMSANSSHSHGTGNTDYPRWITAQDVTVTNASGTLASGSYKFPRHPSANGFSTRSVSESVSVAHTHTVPSSAYTVPRTTNGAVGAVSGATTGDAGNLPPYTAVNRWHRTA